MPNNFESLSHELADDTKLLTQSLGGARGMFESGAPAIFFVIAYSVTNQDLRSSVFASLSIGLILAILRLIKRESLTQVFSGFIGLAFSAWLATKSGKAENFFLPGIITNLIYAAACVISLIINRPLLGYVIESIRGTKNDWRTNKKLLKRYRAMTFLWSAVFLLRVVIMAPLYLANQTVLLGFFKIALGWPLFALAAYLTYALSSKTVKT
jgi:hypothetical protein